VPCNESQEKIAAQEAIYEFVKNKGISH